MAPRTTCVSTRPEGLATLRVAQPGAQRHQQGAAAVGGVGQQLLELRSNGYDLTRILKDHPELRVLGIAAAYVYAAGDRLRYAEFFERDGSLRGPGYTEAEAARLSSQYRVPGIVIKPRRSAA